MKWFVNLATHIKLFLSFGLLVVILLVVVATALTGFSALSQSQEELFRNDFLPTIELIELRSSQNRVRAQILEMIMTKDRAKQQALERNIKERSKEIDEGYKILSEALQGHPQELRQFEEMVSLVADYRKTRDQQISLIYTDKAGEAESLGATVQSERFNRIREIATKLGDTAVAEAKMRITHANARAGMLSRTFVGISLFAFILSVGAA